MINVNVNRESTCPPYISYSGDNWEPHLMLWYGYALTDNLVRYENPTGGMSMINMNITSSVNKFSEPFRPLEAVMWQGGGVQKSRVCHLSDYDYYDYSVSVHMLLGIY